MTRDFMKDGIPQDFASPVGLPDAPGQAREWQQLNRSWWEAHPMRYDFTEAIPFPDGSAEFYREVDARFYRTVREAFPWREIPFDNFIDFASLRRKDVLEIGVGCGSHAQLLAQHARSYTGIDLTSYAVGATQARLNRFGLKGTVLRMDAERMAFADGAFDFVWSWGVIHHSADTRRILEEVHRVLAPGGTFTAMVYHRSLWNTYLRGGLYYGVVRGGLLRTRSVHRLVQETTDGALARYYTRAQWKALVGGLFEIGPIDVIGHKTQLVPLPYGRLKEKLAALIPDSVGRALTNRPFMGYMLVCRLRKADA